MAAPMPLAPPVMTTTLSFSWRSITYLQFRADNVLPLRSGQVKLDGPAWDDELSGDWSGDLQHVRVITGKLGRKSDFDVATLLRPGQITLGA